MNYSEKINILVIEDNQGDFVLIEDYLLEKFKNIEVKHCLDFESSIDYLQKAKDAISVILMDLHLPDLSGDDLITKITGFNFQIPIVILTGYSDLNLAEKSLAMGIDDYLIKDEITQAILHKTIVFSLNRHNYINQIAAEKSNYEGLFNFNPQPTWLLDSKSLKILDANDAAQKKYGFLLQDFLNMTFNQLHAKEEEKLITDKLTLKMSDPKMSYFSHYLSNGEIIKVTIQFKEFNNKSGSKLVVQSYDVSESLKQMKLIDIQNSKLRNIAWAQSNDLQAPISRALGIIEMIEKQPDNLEKISYWVQQLKSSTNEIEKISKKVIKETKTLN